MVEVLRIVLVISAMTGGMVTNGVHLLSAAKEGQECIRIGDNRWDCGNQVCFYYNGAWVCIDE